MHAMYGKGMAGLGSVDFLSLPIVEIPASSAFYLGFLLPFQPPPPPALYPRPQPRPPGLQANYTQVNRF